MTPDLDVLDAAVGECCALDERLVVAPCGGKVRLNGSSDGPAEGEYVLEGQVVGAVAEPNGTTVPIASPFAGWLMGFLVPDGSPVRRGEPVLWLRRV